jgi:hypothetical protein
MNPIEKAQTLKTLTSTNEERLIRLERQMAGFDLFSNVEYAVQTLAESKLPESVVEQVASLPTDRRRNLQTAMIQMLAAIEREDKAEAIEKEIADATKE